MRKDLLRTGTIQLDVRVVLGLEHHGRQRGAVSVRLRVVDQRRAAAAGALLTRRRRASRRRVFCQRAADVCVGFDPSQLFRGVLFRGGGELVAFVFARVVVVAGGGLQPAAQLRQLRGQVVSVDLFVGGVFGLHFPADGRRRGRADEKQPPGVRPVEVFHLALVADGRGLAEVAFGDAVAKECRAVDGLPHSDGRVDVVEGADDAVHGFQRGEGVQRCDGADVCTDRG